MIIAILFVLLVAFSCMRSLSLIGLVIIIINLRLVVASYFYLAFNSILALMWVLVYLGGMIVCFTYLLFITGRERGRAQLKGVFCASGQYPVLIMVGLIVSKMVAVNRRWLINQIPKVSGNMMVSGEGYLQITSHPWIFLFLSSRILLFVTFQILILLNLKGKDFSLYHL